MTKTLLVLAVVCCAWILALAGPTVAAEPERITDDTTVWEVERQIMASETVAITQTTVVLGEVEYPGTITMMTAEVPYTLVTEFIYQPYETADGKWGYPCIGVNRYLVRK